MEEHPGALSLLVGCFVQYARRACVLCLREGGGLTRKWVFTRGQLKALSDKTCGCEAAWRSGDSEA